MIVDQVNPAASVRPDSRVITVVGLPSTLNARPIASSPDQPRLAAARSMPVQQRRQIPDTSAT